MDMTAPQDSHARHWADFVLPPEVRASADPEELRRARVTAGFGIFFVVLPVLIIPLFSQNPWNSPFWMTPGATFLVGFIATALLRLRGAVRPAGIVLTMGLTSLATPILYPLGGVESRSIYWLAFAPLMAMFLLGSRWALFNLILLIAQLAILYALPSLGVNLPAPTIVGPRQLLIITSLFSVLTFFIGWGFEHARLKATSAMIASMQAQKELEVARDAAQLANASKTQFIATMSHELRTPLNTILGYAELLLEEADFDDALDPHRPDLAAIEASGLHLLRMVDDILTLSSLDQDAMSPTLQDVAIGPLFERLRARYEELAKANNNALAVEPGVETVHTDPEMLETCLRHLLDNACRFTQDGNVTLRATHAAGYVVFAVVDDGPGIKSADQEAIYERFHQLDATSTRAHDGSGLGLAITRALAERLGGELTVESAPGTGSAFRLSLSA